MIKSPVEHKKILAIIPAKGKSRGLPQKNLIKIKNKPLIIYTIEAALNSKYISKTIVSSESKKILKIAQEKGAIIIKRPQKLATDTVCIEDVVIDVLNKLKKRKESYSVLVVLQPTSPLRTSQDINQAFEKFFTSKATALISVYKQDKNQCKAFTLNKNGYLKGLIDDKSPFLRRQDLPEVFMPNGAIFIVSVKEFLENKSFLTNKTISFAMSKERSLDIDSYEDLERARKLLKK